MQLISLFTQLNLQLPSDDPTKRKPDISKAKELLDYSPEVSLDLGLKKTIEWFETKREVVD